MQVGDLIKPGDWLCHYTTADVAFNHILPDRELRLSPYRKMRDPAESKHLAPSASRRVDEHETESNERDFAAFGEATSWINQIRGMMRLVSFARDDPDSDNVVGCCWAHPRMWEHYADRHEGVCLVFRRQPLLDVFREQRDFYEGEVDYTLEGIGSSAALHMSDPRIFSHDDAERRQAVLDHIEHHQREFYFLKTEDWRTEWEYRVVLASPSNEYAHLSFGDTLTAVILGDDFDPWQTAAAREACDELGAKLVQVGWWHGRAFPATPRDPIGPRRRGED